MRTIVCFFCQLLNRNIKRLYENFLCFTEAYTLLGLKCWLRISSVAGHNPTKIPQRSACADCRAALSPTSVIVSKLVAARFGEKNQTATERGIETKPK